MSDDAAVILKALLAIAFVFLAGWVAMVAWNGSLVPVLGVKVMSYWEGLCLVLLGRMVFPPPTKPSSK